MNDNLIPFPKDSFKQKDSFTRLDDRDDSIFYSRERLVPHLDSLALETVERLIGNLVIEKNPVILDLMASWDSHIPEKLQPAKITGLGLNEIELKRNPALSAYVIHDLNHNSNLPFPDSTFDVVLNTVSVDYIVKPGEIFCEVARILKPGGLFLVIFSNRMFPEKAVKIWRESKEEERIELVEHYFSQTGAFRKTELYISRGRPRPSNDAYAGYGIPSDPIYAIYAEKAGGGFKKTSRPSALSLKEQFMDNSNLEEKKLHIRETLQCPHCDEKMKKWAVPDNPFEATWDNDFLYVCFNDNCPYYVRGWDHIYKSTARIASYRFMYNPVQDSCAPIPVPSPQALRESIID